MTPTKNESPPELVLRCSENMAGCELLNRCANGGACDCAQELTAALTREAPTEAEPFAWAYEEKGGYRDEAWVERVTRGPLPCWETRNQIPLFATPPAPQRLAQGEEDAFDAWFRAEQGKPYDGMWQFARAAWMARAATQPPHQDRGEVDIPGLAGEGLDYFERIGDNGDKLYVQAIRKHIAALTEAKQQDDDGWEANFRYLLERSQHTLRSREGGGPENLLQSAILTFTRMEQRLEAKQQGPGEAESPSLKQTPAWWVGYSIGHTGRAPYHCIGPDKPPSRYMNDSVHWTPLYTAPQVEAKRQTGED